MVLCTLVERVSGSSQTVKMLRSTIAKEIYVLRAFDVCYRLTCAVPQANFSFLKFTRIVL